MLSDTEGSAVQAGPSFFVSLAAFRVPRAGSGSSPVPFSALLLGSEVARHRSSRLTSDGERKRILDRSAKNEQNGAMTHLGLKSGIVKLVPSHLTEWKEFFEAERTLLAERLGRSAIDIQHIGSTAIPGISAKPIIDIMLGVRRMDRLIELVAILGSLDYVHKGEAGVPGRQFFARGNPTLVHLHMTEHGSPFWHEHIVFRDHLISSAEDREAYASLKQVLAAMYPDDRDAYTAGKSAFITDVLHRIAANKRGQSAN